MSTPTLGAPQPPPTLTDAPPPVLPPALPPVAPDAPPAKRPTTRAGRKAAAEAKRIGTPPADKAPKAAKPLPRKAQLETRLTGSLVALGTTVAATGGLLSPALSADGVLIVEHAASVAAALDKVAKDQPQVHAALERMLTAGVWSGLIAAMLPLAVGIAANHGAIPDHLAQMLGAADADGE